MALSKSEQNLLHAIDNKITLLAERQDNQIATHERLKVDVNALKKTVYENGLNTRVKELHDWMTELRAEKREAQKITVDLLKTEDAQEHEIKLLGIKMSAELKSNIITGFITGSLALLGVVLSK